MATASAPNLIHKTLGVEATVLDEEHGIVEAFVSGVGNKDSVGDIIQPGAFDTYLKIRKPKGVWSHDWDRPVSKTLEIREVAAGSPELPMKMQLAGIGGLYVKTQFNLATKEGRDAFENVKFFGEEAEWSIGYQVHDQEYDKTKKANLLKTIELYEYSPVLFGANALTSTVSIKADRNADGDIECKIEGLDEIQTRAVKAALEVVLKEAPVEDTDTEAQEESDMFIKNEATGLIEVELEDGEVKAFRSEEKAEAFLADCKAYAEAVEAAEAAEKSAEEDIDGEKAVVGSMEERYGKLHAALNESMGEGSYAYVVATFESSVIFESYTESGYSFYQADYSIDEDGEFKFGEPTEVELVEVVIAKTALQEAIKADMISELKDALDEEALTVLEVVEKSIEEKAGRVLSKSNRSALEKAAEAIQAVLDADTTEEGQAEEKTLSEKALDTIEAALEVGTISEDDANLLKSAIVVKTEEVEEADDELEALKGLSDEDLEALKELAEDADTKADDEEIEEDVELDALKDLSDEEIEAVKEWAAALEEKDDEDSDEEDSDDDSEEDAEEDGEKSEDTDLLSAKAELDALSELLSE